MCAFRLDPGSLPGWSSLPANSPSSSHGPRARALGPDGQHANTSESRVQLSLDLASACFLAAVQRERVLIRLAPRLSGTVRTVASETQRSQLKNRQEARMRLAQLLREALAPPVRDRKSVV